jgi:membrane fusion protein (multidrug efflux system)
VAVKLGARRKGEVEIVRGLSAGDRIVTEGAVKLRDGARVSLAEDA